MLSKALLATILIVGLSACSTSKLEPPKPQPREEPINSLALEQCIVENGQQKCTGADQ